MKHGLPKLVFAAASLFLVLALVWFDRDRTSPGPLTTTHALVAELASEDGCDRCHDSSDMADDCTGCHEDVGADLAAKRGFHGATLATTPTVATSADACATCHQEHHGDATPLSGEHAFALAGFASIAEFDHRGLDFRLGGRHAELACDKCHRSAGAASLAKGEKRFLGLVQDCASCHEDVHRGKFGPDCARCHGEEHPFADAANFVHVESFPLVGGHAQKCEECHAPDGPHAVELAQAAQPRECAACHESQHSGPFLGAVATLARTSSDATCALCHDAARGAFAEDSSAMPLELHAASGFALTKPHERARCEQCHEPAKSTFSDRYPGRTADACAACHGDPHRGEFAKGAFRGAACSDCHARDTFDTHSFDVAEHSRTPFALTGAHARIDCDACHAPARDAASSPRDFRTTKTRCEDCHADVHAGEFARVAAARGEPTPRCEDCHGTESFRDVDRRLFDHGARTAFALQGAHARADCESCHPTTVHAELPTRTFGFAADRFPGPSERCDTCHVDVHDGVFDRPGRPPTLDGRATCERCHDVERFRGEHARSFDHGLFTGFALEGGHRRATCESCHGPDPKSVHALGAVADKFRGPTERCETCHQDPHGGRFDAAHAPRELEGRVGCARCHGVESFRDVESSSFDHARWTGFALEEAHARAACEACHVPTPKLRDGMRLGAAAGKDCEACHEDVHAGQFAQLGRTDCAACHRDTGSFREIVFDHARDSRFALDKQHAKLDCAVCHRPERGARGAEVVRYKPLGVECIDCHRPTSGKRRPDDSGPYPPGRSARGANDEHEEDER